MGPSSERRERWLVAGICGVAALHVLLMCAAFPFFNNVDEQAHVDVVLKYARGDFPSQRNVPYDASSGRLFILYRSLEYGHGPESFPRGVIPRPLSTLPPERSEGRVARASATAARTPNHEIHSPPAYYLLASAWYRVGSALGLTDISALYWVRFLNAPLVALACWLAWAFCREAFPGRLDLRLGVPMLLACLPQDAFYSINSDALSVPLLVLSLWLLLRWRSAAAPAAWLSVALGASVATTFLVKLNHAAIVSIGESVGEEETERLLLGETPRYLFPFSRKILSDITQDAAFPPLVINPIDFDQYFNRHKKGTLKATLAAQSGAAQSGAAQSGAAQSGAAQSQDAEPSGPEPGSEAERAAPDAG